MSFFFSLHESSNNLWDTKLNHITQPRHVITFNADVCWTTFSLTKVLLYFTRWSTIWQLWCIWQIIYLKTAVYFFLDEMFWNINRKQPLEMIQRREMKWRNASTKWTKCTRSWLLHKNVLENKTLGNWIEIVLNGFVYQAHIWCSICPCFFFITFWRTFPFVYDLCNLISVQMDLYLSMYILALLEFFIFWYL